MELDWNFDRLMPNADIGQESVLSLPIDAITTMDEVYLGTKNVTSGQGFTIYDIYLE